MKDEVLATYSVDNYEDYEVIPRYDIILPSGETLYEGVQLMLRNNVLVPGTPLNKQNLLSDDTSNYIGLDPATSTPDLAFRALRKLLAGICPKIVVQYTPGKLAHIRNMTTYEEVTQIVPESGYATFEVWEYSKYHCWGTDGSISTNMEEVLVDSARIYEVAP